MFGKVFFIVRMLAAVEGRVRRHTMLAQGIAGLRVEEVEVRPTEMGMSWAGAVKRCREEGGKPYRGRDRVGRLNGWSGIARVASSCHDKDGIGDVHVEERNVT